MTNHSGGLDRRPRARAKAYVPAHRPSPPLKLGGVASCCTRKRAFVRERQTVPTSKNIDRLKMGMTSEQYHELRNSIRSRAWACLTVGRGGRRSDSPLPSLCARLWPHPSAEAPGARIGGLVRWHRNACHPRFLTGVLRHIRNAGLARACDEGGPPHSRIMSRIRI